MNRRLTPAKFDRALDYLIDIDKDLNSVIQVCGAPPMWEREPGFATLVRIILEQQVSVASAKAAFDRLCGLVSSVSPENVLKLNDEEMKSAYFSRQKTRYTRILAGEILNGNIDLQNLEHLPDDEVREILTGITGVGRWTADIYLLMALMRGDILPRGDRALLVSCKTVKRLNSVPDNDEFSAIAENWKPYRAVASRILWQAYLKKYSPE